MLLERKADLNVKNQKGRTALSFAVGPSMNRPTAIDTLHHLLDARADPLERDDNGWNAKRRAIEEGRYDAYTILKEFETDHATSCPVIAKEPVQKRHRSSDVATPVAQVQKLVPKAPSSSNADQQMHQRFFVCAEQGAKLRKVLTQWNCRREVLWNIGL